MGQSFLCALALDGERREKRRIVSALRSLHLDVCVRMLTHEQGISIYVLASGQTGFDSVP